MGWFGIDNDFVTLYHIYIQRQNSEGRLRVAALFLKAVAL